MNHCSEMWLEQNRVVKHEDDGYLKHNLMTLLLIVNDISFTICVDSYSICSVHYKYLASCYSDHDQTILMKNYNLIQ